MSVILAYTLMYLPPLIGAFFVYRHQKQKQEELQNPIREKILAAIKSVSEENGFTYIFDTNALLFKSASATDITDLVLKKLGVTK